jgi:hypothetical protein
MGPLALALAVVGLIVLLGGAAGAGNLERLGGLLRKLRPVKEGPFYANPRISQGLKLTVGFILLMAPGGLVYVFANGPFQQSVNDSLWATIQFEIPPIVIVYLVPLLVRLFLAAHARIARPLLLATGGYTVLFGLGIIGGQLIGA